MNVDSCENFFFSSNGIELFLCFFFSFLKRIVVSGARGYGPFCRKRDTAVSGFRRFD